MLPATKSGAHAEHVSHTGTSCPTAHLQTPEESLSQPYTPGGAACLQDFGEIGYLQTCREAVHLQTPEKTVSLQLQTCGGGSPPADPWEDVSFANAACGEAAHLHTPEKTNFLQLQACGQATHLQTCGEAAH